jgi:hypothetical protein
MRGRVVWWVLAPGCGQTEPEPDGADEQPPGLSQPPEPEGPRGRLLVEELYYAGSPPMGGADHYFSDQFIDLVNVSDVPVLAGGLLVGDVFGLAGAFNPGDEPDAHADDAERVYLQNVWQIPGAPDEVIVPAGGTLLLAHDGVNHSPSSVVDLSGADFEAFVAGSERDEDSPTVANLQEVHFTGGYDWLMTVFGPSVVLLEPGTALEPFDEGWVELRTAPADSVLDAVEALMDADSGAFKRLPASVDAGFVHVSGTYTGESVRRRKIGDQWQDTDDSGADFERLAVPEPSP